MDHAAPELLQALEASAFAAGIRQSVWLYPLANISHVVAVVVFASAVAVMDIRLLGFLQETAPGRVLTDARTVALAAFAVVALTGFLLFAAEASHLALNAVFQTKVILILLALSNVALFEFAFAHRVGALQPGAPMPAFARTSAAASLALWLTVVALGRSIAYF